MDVLKRLRRLMNDRGWSDYMLAKKSGVHESTVYSMFKKGNTPTVPTLQNFCKGLGITMAEFFSDGETPNSLSMEQIRMFEKWSELSDEQQELLMKLIDNMRKEEDAGAD